MRAPFQILAIPYKCINKVPLYCVLHRSDVDETPIEAAKREISEEGGVVVTDVITLTSICYVPVEIFPKRHLYNWANDMYVIPEHSFGFECEKNIVLSHEHTECVWLTYEQAKNKLKWDSNKTALYELNCRLINKI